MLPILRTTCKVLMKRESVRWCQSSWGFAYFFITFRENLIILQSPALLASSVITWSLGEFARSALNNSTPPRYSLCTSLTHVFVYIFALLCKELKKYFVDVLKCLEKNNSTSVHVQYIPVITCTLYMHVKLQLYIIRTCTCRAFL